MPKNKQKEECNCWHTKECCKKCNDKSAEELNGLLSTPPIKEWQKRFIDFWYEKGEYKEGRKLGVDEYINFITQTLADERKRLVEIVKSKRHGSDCKKRGCNFTYNQAIDDILSIINDTADGVLTPLKKRE